MLRTVVFTCLMLSLGLAPLGGQMRPDAPIRDFRLPRFNEHGYKLWELRGSEGRYVSEEVCEIVELDLRVFSGDRKTQLESRIVSPWARVYLEQAAAEGESTLSVTGPNFEVSGEDWHYDGREKKLVVRRNAHVVLHDTIDLLR